MKVERQHWNVKFWEQFSSGEDAAMATKQQVMDRIAWTKREQAYLLDHRTLFESRLC
jgi:hypothetical protein